jgi:rubrerythrin
VDLEKKAMETYESKAAESQDADEKKLLELLAKEEKRHYFLLQNLLDFIQEPQRYLDDAEFSRLDDSYAGVV